MKNPSLEQELAGLARHAERLEPVHLSELFDREERRFEQFSACLDDLVFDYSKNRIDLPVMEALFGMARTVGLEEKRAAMFAGEPINTTEKRAVLHVALRGSVSRSLKVNGISVAEDVQKGLESMQAFCRAVRSGKYKVTGGKVTDVVNIGIGGSDLGPRMAAEALDLYHDGPRTHFVSNVDFADIGSKLGGLDAKSTLLVIASKSFTTTETMKNARTARQWLVEAVGEEAAAQHLVALSTSQEATAAFGVPEENCFGFRDWVGGRFSVWSAIGLTLMLAIGEDNFDAFLAGARSADDHFQNEPLETNIPVLMGLLGIWNINVLGMHAFACLPYDNRLTHFPGWLQQLEMESNGKSVRVDGSPVTFATAPIVFGQPGTNGQHAFYQLLHQGTQIVPCDFLVSCEAAGEADGHRTALVANCLAQAEALMLGRRGGDVADPHRQFEGNRPSNTLLYRRLDPKTLGLLMALYEHKTFVQGAIWGINSFDQFGVELGKEIAGEVEEAIAGNRSTAGFSGSTAALIRSYRKFRGDR